LQTNERKREILLSSARVSAGNVQRDSNEGRYEISQFEAGVVAPAKDSEIEPFDEGSCDDEEQGEDEVNEL
jgi:hypothetical protein